MDCIRTGVVVVLVACFPRSWLSWPGSVPQPSSWSAGACTASTSPSLFMIVTTVLILLAAVFGLPPLRRTLLSRFVMPIFAKVLPRLGDTERIALEAGTVWWDADLFSGMPEWQKLLDFKARPLERRRAGFPRRAGQ